MSDLVGTMPQRSGDAQDNSIFLTDSEGQRARRSETQRAPKLP